METKTLQQAKDYVAQLNGYSNWERISYTEIADFERASLIDDVAEYYASEVAKAIKKEIKEKCEKAFRSVMTAALLSSAIGNPIDIETELKNQMDNI